MPRKELYAAIDSLRQGDVHKFREIIRSELYRRGAEEVATQKVVVGMGMVENNESEMFAQHKVRRMKEIEGDNVHGDEKPMKRAPKKRADNVQEESAGDSDDEDEPAVVENFKRPAMSQRRQAGYVSGFRSKRSGGFLKSIFGGGEKKKPAAKSGPQPMSADEEMRRKQEKWHRQQEFNKWKSDQKPKKPEPEAAQPKRDPKKEIHDYFASKGQAGINRHEYLRRKKDRQRAAFDNRETHQVASTGTKTWNKETNADKMKALAKARQAELKVNAKRGKMMSDAEYNAWHDARKKANESININEASERHVNPDGSYRHDWDGLSQLASQNGQVVTPQALKAAMQGQRKMNIGGGTYHYSLQSRAEDDVKKFMETEGPEISRLQMTPKEMIIHYASGEPIVHKLGDGSRRTYYQHFYKHANERLKLIRGTKTAKLKESLSPSGNRIFQEIMHEMETNSFGVEELKSKIANRLKNLSDADQTAIRKKLTGN